MKVVELKRNEAGKLYYRNRTYDENMKLYKKADAILVKKNVSNGEYTIFFPEIHLTRIYSGKHRTNVLRTLSKSRVGDKFEITCIMDETDKTIAGPIQMILTISNHDFNTREYVKAKVVDKSKSSIQDLEEVTVVENGCEVKRGVYKDNLYVKGTRIFNHIEAIVESVKLTHDGTEYELYLPKLGINAYTGNVRKYPKEFSFEGILNPGDRITITALMNPDLEQIYDIMFVHSWYSDYIS